MERIPESTVHEDEGVAEAAPVIWTHEDVEISNRFAKTLVKLKLCRAYGKSEKWEYGKLVHRSATFGNPDEDDDDSW